MAKKQKKKSSKKNVLSVLLIALLLIGGYIGYRFLKGNPIEIPQFQEKPKIKIVDEESKMRAYAVMINNIDIARPYHSGLQDAYIMYEMIVEGGITRYLALFSNQTTERIGPVRSARHYYIDYVLENDAYYIHWGYSNQAKNDLSKYNIQNINGMYQDQYFWKDKTLRVSTEHTAFTSMELLSKGVDTLDYRTKRNQDYLLNYQVDEIDLSTNENAFVANSVSIPYSRGSVTSYTYDTEKKVYNRFVNGNAHTDYVTKQQYTFKNIITYKVKNYTIPGDTSGRQTLEDVGSGTGYYITNGYAVPIRWEKKSREAQTIYKYPDGTVIRVNDGNTFIQIQPESQKLSIS